MLKLTDQPVQIILAVTEEEAERLLDLVRTEQVHVFYMRFPIEFGLIGEDVLTSHRYLPYSVARQDMAILGTLHAPERLLY